MNKGLQNIYSKIPKIYEFMNHVLTFGTDIYCRRKAVAVAVRGGGGMWLDMCSGTGETAAYLCKEASEDTQIVAADFSVPMMHEAKKKGALKNVPFVATDANLLPFSDNTFDLITITFATRNICVTDASRDASLSEFYRVLKKDGRFINLETSQPSNRFIRRAFHCYADKCIKFFGWFTADSKDGYRYLSESMQRFYSAEEFAAIIKAKGFSEVKVHKLMTGAVAIHEAIK